MLQTIIRYIEWNNGSLAIPRKCDSNAAKIAADVEHSICRKDVDLALDKIADVIVEWNVNKTYSMKKNNCQVFIDDLIDCLGEKLEFGSKVAGYLQKLRSKGSCKLKYHIPKEIQEIQEIQEIAKELNSKEKIIFRSHQELDKFTNVIVGKLPLFAINYKDDYFLLKSFDRAFWLRHYKSSMDTGYKPDEKGCPFKDPKDFSLKSDWYY